MKDNLNMLTCGMRIENANLKVEADLVSKDKSTDDM